MNGAKLAGLVVIGILLFTTVGAANVVTTADRTILNGEYVSQTIEEENAYDSIRDKTVEEVLERMQSANLSEGQTLLQAGNGTDNRTLVENAVTESYIRSQTDENIVELYAYLNGDRDELYMDIDLRPLKDNLAEEFGKEIERKETGTLVEEFGPDDEDTPVPIERELLEKMQSGPEGYEEARLDFRVDVAFEVTTDDQKLLLIGEDPRQYSESEKDNIIDQREDEIRSELRDELRTDPDVITIEGERIEVGDRIDDRRQNAKDEACDRTRDKLDSDASDYEVCNGYDGGVSGAPPEDNMTQAAVQFQYVIIDGLTDDFYDYEEFMADLDQAESDLSTETSDLASARIEQEVPNTLTAEEQFGQGTMDDLRSARSGVGAAGLASLLLPVIALVLIGLAYGLTRSPETTAKMTGIVLVVVGGLHLLVATVLKETILSRVESAAAGSSADELVNLVITLFDGMFSVLATQSLALFVVGVILIALVAANRRGHLEAVKARAGIGTAGNGTGGQPPTQSQHGGGQGERDGNQ